MHRRSASGSATEGNTQRPDGMQKRGSTDQSVMAGSHSSSAGAPPYSRFRAEAEAEAEAKAKAKAKGAAPVKATSEDDHIVCQSKLYDAYELQELEHHLDRKLDFQNDRNIRSFSMPRWYDPAVAAEAPVDLAVQEQEARQGLAGHEYPASSSTAKVGLIKAPKPSRAKRSRWPLVNSFFRSGSKKQNNMLITKEDPTLHSSSMNGSLQPWNRELHHHRNIVHHHHVHHHHHHHIMTGVHFEEIDWPLSPGRLEELGWLMSKSCPKSKDL